MFFMDNSLVCNFTLSMTTELLIGSDQAVNPLNQSCNKQHNKNYDKLNNWAAMAQADTESVRAILKRITAIDWSLGEKLDAFRVFGKMTGKRKPGMGLRTRVGRSRRTMKVGNLQIAA